MSHYTVLVVGEDHEYQLAPFHEFECTGVNDEFVQDIDITDKVLEQIKESGTLNDALEYYGLEKRCVTDESEVDRNDKHKYGYAVLSPQGTLVKAVDRTNPNKRWDGYHVGGRWAGHFLIKPEFQALYQSEQPNFSWGWDAKEAAKVAEENRVDSAIKAHIDFARMAAIKAKEAADEYDFVYRDILKDLPPNEAWPVVREGKSGSLDEAKEIYWAQPRCAAWKEYEKRCFEDKTLRQVDFMDSPDRFLVSREQFISLAERSACTTFAFLRNRQWEERGRMGWFACVSNENDAWDDVFARLLADVPDTERLTVVDCHI